MRGIYHTRQHQCELNLVGGVCLIFIANGCRNPRIQARTFPKPINTQRLDVHPIADEKPALFKGRGV
jgi:hypothetical protein